MKQRFYVRARIRQQAMSERLSNLFGWAIAVPIVVIGIIVISVVAALALSISSLVLRQIWVSDTPFMEFFQDFALVTMALLLIVTNRRVAHLQKQLHELLQPPESPK